MVALLSALAGGLGPVACTRGERPFPARDRAAAPAGDGDVRGHWRARLAWSDDCEDAYAASYDGAQSGITVYGLSAGRRLVEVACAAGSYQGSYLYFLVEGESEGRAGPLDFPIPTWDGEAAPVMERESELWGEPDQIPGSDELALLHWGRQTRDCGFWARYAFVGGEVEMRELRASMPCPAAMGPAIEAEARVPPAWPRVDLDHHE